MTIEQANAIIKLWDDGNYKEALDALYKKDISYKVDIDDKFSELSKIFYKAVSRAAIMSATK